MRKKGLVFVIVMVFLISTVQAIDIKVKNPDIADIPAIIPSLKNVPAKKTLEITNFGLDDNFRFYNIVGFGMGPVGAVSIPSGLKKDVQILVYPKEDFDIKGNLKLTYFIKGNDGTEIEENIILKIVELEDAFEIGSTSFEPESSSLEVFIKNKENFDFGEISVEFSSPFFKTTRKFNLENKERKEFNISLDDKDFEKLVAGKYNMKAIVKVDGEEAEIDGSLEFLEKDLVEESEDSYGIIVNTNVLTKKNRGNVNIESVTVYEKNILSRLFTTFSPIPDSTERHGLKVSYTWKKELKPGDVFNVTTKTNWTYPLILIIFIVVVVIVVKRFSIKPLMIRKKVTFVKTKGGEFAVKVTLILSANKPVSRIKLIDKLPHLVKVHEQFGFYHPNRIDEVTRRIEWELGSLDKGEKRALSYIIYSKVGVLGRFSLPSANAVFESNGKIYESNSNRAFLLSEQGYGEDEEDYGY